MTKFNKAQFEKFGGYVHYIMDDGERKFVYRDRNNRAGGLITFLIKNFTVEEYFQRLNALETPLHILESKGYILPHIKKWLKEGGYPVTREGYRAFLAKRVADTNKRLSA